MATDATGHTVVEDAAVEATCTTDGKAAGSHCSVCNAVIMEGAKIPALGHDYQNAVTTAPTCTENGYTTHTCSQCENSYKDTVVIATGHRWSDWEEKTPATATQDGEKTRTCSVCGEVETGTIPATDGESHTHSYTSSVTTVPTCTTAGVRTYTCSCGASYTEEIPANGHRWNSWSVTRPATATTAGEETRTCSACGATGTRSIPATGGGTTSGGGGTGGGGNTGGTVEIQDPDVTLAGLPMLFTDVGKDAYYYDAVAWAVQQGITSGTSETTFSPDAFCTRAQVMTFLWRFAEKPDSANSTNPFVDVADGAYYHSAVLWAVEKEITKGTSAEAFSPDNTITRAQTVTFLYRYMA